MDAAAAGLILDRYAEWWRSGFDVVQEGEGVRIITPMLDRHNDHMSLYLAEGEGGLVLTDIGATIGDLTAGGCDVLGSPKRSERLDAVLRGYGLSREGGEVYVRTGRDRLFESMNMLMQGLATVDDLFFTVRSSVRSFYLEDVRDWLDGLSIRYVENVNLVGKSGFSARFDFVIPKSKAAPERYVKTVSSPSEQSVKNFLFGWSDIMEARGNGRSYLFLNAENSVSGSVEPSLLEACRSYGVVPAVLGRDDEALGRELAA